MWRSRFTQAAAPGLLRSCPTGAWCAGVACLLFLSGCYAPLVSVGTPATLLPDEFRMPMRTAGEPLNYAALTRPPGGEYLLGPDDVLEVTIPDLYEGGPMTPMRVRVMPDGQISLPLVGGVRVDGMTISQAQAAIADRYAQGYLVQPRVIVFLADMAKVRVLVFGEVKNPGVYELFKTENDVGHALAAAGGLTEEAAEVVELHRRVPAPAEAVSPPPLRPGETEVLPDVQTTGPSSETESVAPAILPAVSLKRLPATEPNPLAASSYRQPGRSVSALSPTVPRAVVPASAHTVLRSPLADPKQVLHFPLRGLSGDAIPTSDILLQAGDAVVVPSRRHEVFFVVGKLNPVNVVRFTASERDRELGTGFVLPRDREIDAVTAVAMAGYIDPIDSPTTVTVHRTMPDGCPMLIRVDLIKARCNPKENVLIRAGDIVYLNPDGWWWFRRTFDRVIPELFTIPYSVGWGLNAN